MLSDAPVAPAWLVLPMAVSAVLIVLVHLSALHDRAHNTHIPLSRRRLRTAGGVVTLITIPVLAYAFGIATPVDAKGFTMSWAASVGLLGMIVIVAGLDALNSIRLHRHTADRTERKRDELLAQLHAALHSTSRDEDLPSEHDR